MMTVLKSTQRVLQPNSGTVKGVLQSPSMGTRLPALVAALVIVIHGIDVIVVARSAHIGTTTVRIGIAARTINNGLTLVGTNTLDGGSAVSGRGVR